MTDPVETDKPVASGSEELLRSIIELKPGGEVREQQLEAVREVESAITNNAHLLLEAPTGSGKGFSYLTPLIQAGKKAVVSTATKQLSEQLHDSDAPFLLKAVSEVAPEKKFSFALLKGRDNYFCKAKASKLSDLEAEASAMFALDGDEVKASSSDGERFAAEAGGVIAWSNNTRSGDRSEAPAVSDKTWRQFSSSSAECPGKRTCPFGSECFAERARTKAKEVDIVFTNHAMVAHDFTEGDSASDEDGEVESVFGERDVFVFDELHQLDSYLTSAWSGVISAAGLADTVKLFRGLRPLKQETLEAVERIVGQFGSTLRHSELGVIEGEDDRLDAYLAKFHKVVARVVLESTKIAQDKEQNERTRNAASLVMKTASQLEDYCELLMDSTVNTVRWVSEDDEGNRSLHASPLRVGPQLQNGLAARDAIMIGASATITVSNSFDIPVHNLGLKSSTKKHREVELDTPFDFSKQAMLFVPDAASFPAPIGADRFEHTEAVKVMIADLVAATGGRALCLFTTSKAAQENAEYLRAVFPKAKILAQGDAPNKQLIEEFKEDANSVLVATAGLWQGTDIPGPSLSLVVMDKLPFKPMDDPLMTARRDFAEKSGRNGFMDVYVAEAQAMLSQGEGRLVRASTDRGVVAILDTRLLTKPYGRSMLNNLPMVKAGDGKAAKVFTSKALIVGALERLNSSLSGGEKVVFKRVAAPKPVPVERGGGGRSGSWNKGRGEWQKKSQPQKRQARK